MTSCLTFSYSVPMHVMRKYNAKPQRICIFFCNANFYFRFQVFILNFEFWFWIPNFDFEFWIVRFDVWILVFGFCFLIFNCDFWILEFPFRTRDWKYSARISRDRNIIFLFYVYCNIIANFIICISHHQKYQQPDVLLVNFLFVTSWAVRCKSIGPLFSTP